MREQEVVRRRSGSVATPRRPAPRYFALGSSSNTRSGVAANTRSPAVTRIVCIPVNAPNAGYTPNSGVSQKHGRRSQSCARPPTLTHGWRWPASAYAPGTGCG